MKPIRAVADTNILVSAIFWEGNESKVIHLVEEGKLRLYISPKLLKELKDVLSYEKFGLDKKEIEESIEYILTFTEVILPKRRVNLIQEDPPDNRVLECALQCRANYIISGNHHLLQLKEFKKIKIVDAGELVKELGEA